MQSKIDSGLHKCKCKADEHQYSNCSDEQGFDFGLLLCGLAKHFKKENYILDILELFSCHALRRNIKFQFNSWLISWSYRSCLLERFIQAIVNERVETGQIYFILNRFRAFFHSEVWLLDVVTVGISWINSTPLKQNKLYLNIFNLI